MAVDLSKFLGSVIRSPVQRIREGVLFGQEQADRATELEAARVKREQQQKQNAALADFAQKKGKTAQDFIDIQTQFPSLAANFQIPLDALNAEQRKTAISQATNVFAALQNGNIEGAISLLEDEKTASENSGDEIGARRAEILIESIKLNPDAALTSAGLFLSQAVGGEKFAATFEALEAQGTKRTFEDVNLRQKFADLGKTQAETKKLIKEVADGKKAGATDMSPSDIEAAGLPIGTVAQRTKDNTINVIFKPEVAGEKPLTTIGRFNKALEKREITQEQFDAKMTKELGLSGETAFKAAGIVQASDALPQLRELLFTDDGDLRESNILLSGVPGATEARQTRALSRTVIGAMLRGESGAVISQDEIDEALDIFLPKLADSDESALLKFEQLEKRINGARRLLLPEVSSPSTPQFKEGDTATGPSGEKLVFRNGQWQRT